MFVCLWHTACKVRILTRIHQTSEACCYTKAKSWSQVWRVPSVLIHQAFGNNCKAQRLLAAHKWCIVSPLQSTKYRRAESSKAHLKRWAQGLALSLWSTSSCVDLAQTPHATNTEYIQRLCIRGSLDWGCLRLHQWYATWSQMFTHSRCRKSVWSDASGRIWRRDCKCQAL